MDRSQRVFCLLLCLACTGAAQQTAPPAAPQDQNRPGLTHRPAPHQEASQGKVKIDVLVTDTAGHPVAGLTQQDFTLLDNQKPQPILSFRAVDGSTGDGTLSEPPVEVILLIDEANNRLTNVAYERYQIDRFLRQNGGHLAQPVTLMIFTDRGVQTQPQPTRDGNALARSI